MITDVLAGYKIDFETIDVSSNRDELTRMRRIVGNETALAPQIANGEEYCGVSIAPRREILFIVICWFLITKPVTPV